MQMDDWIWIEGIIWEALIIFGVVENACTYICMQTWVPIPRAW